MFSRYTANYKVFFTSYVVLIFLTHSVTEGDDANKEFCEDKQYCSLHGSKLICSNGLNDSYSHASYRVEHLILCYWPDDYLDLSNVISQFINVKKIHIRQSYVTQIYGNKNQYVTSLKELNLSNIFLKYLSLPYLDRLSSFDISNNLMENFGKEHLLMMPLLEKLYLRGNPINCSSDLQWLLEESQNPLLRLIDEKETFCANDNYKDKPILGIMKLFKDMEKNCLNICKCTLDKVVGDLIPIISVNCNNSTLTNFPDKIPVNTTILLLQHNKITNLMPLVNDRQYWNVKDVYLDYNEIKNIDMLEGSYWLNNFRLVSFQGNSITQLHTYSLDNAFEHNQYLMRVYFGFNPWSCDCNFAPGFRELLLKYHELVKDINDIQCAYQENDENSMLPIAELPVKAFCVDHSLPLHPLDYLSLVFASLTLLILCNLFYDCWRFKRTGKVPWIVTYMP